MTENIDGTQPEPKVEATDELEATNVSGGELQESVETAEALTPMENGQRAVQTLWEGVKAHPAYTAIAGLESAASVTFIYEAVRQFSGGNPLTQPGMPLQGDAMLLGCSALVFAAVTALVAGLSGREVITDGKIRADIKRKMGENNG